MEADLANTVEERVYAQINDSINECINDVVTFCVKEALT